MLICPVFPQAFRIINNLEKRFNFSVMNSCRQNKQAGEAAKVSQALNTFCCLLLSPDPGLNLEQFLPATPECKSRELLEPGELTLIYCCALIPAAFIPSVFIPAAGTALERWNCSLFPALGWEWLSPEREFSSCRGYRSRAGFSWELPREKPCPWGIPTSAWLFFQEFSVEASAWLRWPPPDPQNSAGDRDSVTAQVHGTELCPVSDIHSLCSKRLHTEMIELINDLNWSPGIASSAYLRFNLKFSLSLSMANDSLAWNSGSEFLLFSLHLNSMSKLQDSVHSCPSSAWTPVAVGESISRSGFKLFALLLKSNSQFLFHISGCRGSIMGTSRVCPVFPVVLLPTLLHILGEVQCLGWGWGSLSSPQSPDFLQLEPGVQAARSLLSSPSWNAPVLPLWNCILAAFRAQALQDFPKALESTRDFLDNYWVWFIEPGLWSLNEEFVPFKISQFTTILYCLKISS